MRGIIITVVMCCLFLGQISKLNENKRQVSVLPAYEFNNKFIYLTIKTVFNTK